MTWFALGLSIGLVLGYLVKVGIDRLQEWNERRRVRGWYDF